MASKHRKRSKRKDVTAQSDGDRQPGKQLSDVSSDAPKSADSENAQKPFMLKPQPKNWLMLMLSIMLLVAWFGFMFWLAT